MDVTLYTRSATMNRCSASVGNVKFPDMLLLEYQDSRGEILMMTGSRLVGAGC
jgi:hypothetical protein